MASQNQTKKSRKRGKLQQKGDKDLLQTEQIPDVYEGLDGPSSSADVEDGNKTSSSQTSFLVPSRSAVLRACTLTSALIAAFGVLIRQVPFLIPKILNDQVHVVVCHISFCFLDHGFIIIQFIVLRYDHIVEVIMLNAMFM